MDGIVLMTRLDTSTDNTGSELTLYIKRLFLEKVMSKLKKPNTITMATSYLMLNELNNLGSEIFHSVNQLKVWKKKGY